jgi:hypothetical protein
MLVEVTCSVDGGWLAGVLDRIRPATQNLLLLYHSDRGGLSCHLHLLDAAMNHGVWGAHHTQTYNAAQPPIFRKLNYDVSRLVVFWHATTNPFQTMVRPSSRQSFSLPCCVMQANHLTSLAVDTRAATQDIRRSQWTRSTLAHILTAVVLRLVSLGTLPLACW